jgi:potassium-transporting ATPase potassium-binding subunit
MRWSASVFARWRWIGSLTRCILVMAVFSFLILVFQDRLPVNPRHLAGMDPVLAFNTAISFITNTDWQAYSGETSLSNFSQMAAITFPMFTSATTGFVVAMAFIRAFTIRDASTNLGNFYRDFIRFTTRVLLPVSFVLACDGRRHCLSSWCG